MKSLLRRSRLCWANLPRLLLLLPLGEKEDVLEAILVTAQRLGSKGLIALTGTVETAASLPWLRNQTNLENASTLLNYLMKTNLVRRTYMSLRIWKCVEYNL